MGCYLQQEEAAGIIILLENKLVTHKLLIPHLNSTFPGNETRPQRGQMFVVTGIVEHTTPTGSNYV